MESSSSNSVNSTPGWSGGSRTGAAPSADPMAFFDLIMKSSQAMATQGSKSFDPIASTNAGASSNEPYTALTDDPKLHDGYEDSSTPYGSQARARETSDDDQHNDQPIEQEDTAAVAEFSEQSSAREKDEGEPDQAALETSAAAGQQEQLLGAPDPLAEAEQAEVEQQSPIDNIGSDSAKQEPKIPGEVNTEQTLDTANPSEQASNQQQDSTTDLTAESVQSESKESDVQSVSAAEEASVANVVEASPGEETSEVHSKDKGKLELESVEQEGAEETIDAEVNLENGDGSSDESSQQHQKNTSTQRAESKKADSVDVVEPTTTSFTDSSTVAAVSKASEALAAVASGSTPSAPPTAGSNTSNNNAGVNNLATLLQRGIQRGSLQKAEGSPSPQLDTKQQIRLVNRVARAVESTPPGQSIKIRLNPSELGQLKVEIKIENGNMTAKIEAENPATRQVLLENLPQLRERLAESNINVQQFEVELMGQQTPQDGSASTFADHSDHQDGSQNSNRQGARSSSEEESASSTRETVNKDAERDSRNLNVTV